jgi:hypothetical protein
MTTLLYLSAPLIYILIILFSSWVGLQSGREGRRRTNVQPVIAILAGLSACPLTAVLIQMGNLGIPQVDMLLPAICLTLGLGFCVGFGYIWAAQLVLDSTALTSIFVLGTTGGAAISLYFYFFYSQVQEFLIASAWGFLFGVLVYMVLKGGMRNSFSGRGK